MGLDCELYLCTCTRTFLLVLPGRGGWGGKRMGWNMRRWSETIEEMDGYLGEDEVMKSFGNQKRFFWVG